MLLNKGLYIGITFILNSLLTKKPSQHLNYSKNSQLFIEILSVISEIHCNESLLYVRNTL